MDKTEVKIENLNNVDEDFINKAVEKRKTIIKVTQEVFYELYEKDDKEINETVDEWFNKGFVRHAYRDASRLPWVNLLKVEKLKRK